MCISETKLEGNHHNVKKLLDIRNIGKMSVTLNHFRYMKLFLERNLIRISNVGKALGASLLISLTREHNVEISSMGKYLTDIHIAQKMMESIQK